MYRERIGPLGTPRDCDRKKPRLAHPANSDLSESRLPPSLDPPLAASTIITCFGPFRARIAKFAACLRECS